MGKFGASHGFYNIFWYAHKLNEEQYKSDWLFITQVQFPSAFQCAWNACIFTYRQMTSYYKFGGWWFCIFLRWIAWHIHKSKSDYNLYDSLQYKILGKISFSFLKFHKSSFFIPKLSKVLFSPLNFANVLLFVLLLMSVNLCPTWLNGVLTQFTTSIKLIYF